MPSHRMSSWFNFRSVTSRRLLDLSRGNGRGMMERWRNTSELFIMRCRLKYAERHHLSPFPCMRKDCYPRKNSFLPSLQSGTTVVTLQYCRSSLGKQLGGLVVVSFLAASCSPSARIVNETATGGTVLYTYIEDYDVLTSPGRKDALRLLDEKCPTGYRITREGEVPRISKAVDRAWMGQVSSNGQPSREKDWAIQFACK
jgi:hypothetical protein